jgi:PST family polysaccharide transporter
MLNRIYLYFTDRIPGINTVLNYKSILSNTFYLTIIEVVRLILPFIALPYIIRIVGTEKYGTIAFAQSIIAYFAIMINFGLDVSAVRMVSLNRTNLEKLNETVSAVLTIKAILFVISGLFFMILVFSVNTIRLEWLVFCFTFISCTSEFLFPAWFFQGIERMKIITVVRLIAIVFYVSTIFIFIKQQSDYIYVPLLQSLGLFISGFIGLFILLRQFSIRLIAVSNKVLWITFKESIPFFLSRASGVLNIYIARTLSGFFLGMTDVAVLDLAQKITNVATLPLSMLNNAIFPHNSKNQNKRFVTKAFLAIILCSAGLAVIVYVFTPFVVKFLSGSELLLAIPVTRILTLWILIVGISYYTGTPTLVAMGFAKPFNYSVIWSTVLLLGNQSCCSIGCFRIVHRHIQDECLLQAQTVFVKRIKHIK